MPTSESSTHLSLAIFATICILSLAIHKLLNRDRRRQFPPGPTALPIIGNLLDLPVKRQYAIYASWARLYGDVISLNVFGEIVVIINTHVAAKELLGHRGASFSDRPTIPFAELTRVTRNSLAMMHYGDPWQTRRHFIDPTLRPSSIVEYQPTQHEHAIRMVQGMLKYPHEFSASVILSVAYGYDIKNLDDEYIRVAEEANQNNIYIVPGALLVNHIPFLQYVPHWMPGGGFHALVDSTAKAIEDTVAIPFAFVKKGMASRNGTARPCLVTQALGKLPDTNSTEGERIIAEAFSGVYVAGSDTISIVLSNLMLALCLYPSTQREARQEIDKVVGRERLPKLSDRASLPYIDAFCQELLRWRLVTPLALPHAATEDSVYNGYTIPKGELSPVNLLPAMIHDSETYPEPERFLPERFIKNNVFIEDPLVSSVFGFGKRKCPGRHFADTSIWTFAVVLLATCEVFDARDELGMALGDDVEHVDRLLSHPPPFTFTVCIRDEKAIEGLHTEYAAFSA
ncbi:cytochrome P450 [Amylostereum chailletii]|nr:cytochrome P450 [Amylostereum chailletii]